MLIPAALRGSTHLQHPSCQARDLLNSLSREYHTADRAQSTSPEGAAAQEETGCHEHFGSLEKPPMLELNPCQTTKSHSESAVPSKGENL